MSDRCSLYWIKSKTHTDMFTEGYIGISHDPHNRIRQHVGFARVKQNHHRQNSEFKKILKDGSFEQKVLLVGTPEYCLGVEKKLRPNKDIGWNLAVGGDGGYAYKHGLTGTKVKGDFYNMLTRARERGLKVWEGWVGEGSVENFASFMDCKPKGTQLVIPNHGILSPDTVIFKTRSELMRYANSKYFHNNRYYSVSELADEYNLKPNTISTRLKRGWSVSQAVGVLRRGNH